MHITGFINRLMKFRSNSRNQRDPNVWVFGEWFGKRTGDNVAYFAEYIAEHYPEIKLYWLCDKSCDTSSLHPKIQVLEYHSQEAVEISKKAAVAVMGEGIADLNSDTINYWGNAVKVNLWHGVMWKKIGYDAEKKKPNAIVKALRKKMYHYDLMETTSEEYTRNIKNAFWVEDEHLVQAGLPRNKVFFSENEIQKCRADLLNRIGVTDAKIICYLPTFRDSGTVPFSFGNIQDKDFEQWLTDNNVYIIQKAHAVEKNSFTSGMDRVLNISDIPAQHLMAGSDMLVTDYSSCFFDYLILDRPIIHYIYDYDYYKNKDRGLYYNKEEMVCGDAPENEESLILAIKENLTDPSLRSELRSKRRDQYMTYESPDSCKIIAERVINKVRNEK